MENLICAKCGGEISKEELVECPVCWELYHRECWVSTKKCVTCNKINPDYVEEPEPQEEEEQTPTEKQGYSEIDSQEEEEAFAELPPPAVANGAQNAVAMISKVILIIAVIVGVLRAVPSFILGGATNYVLGVVNGLVAVAIGWVVSVLVNGFAQLVDSSEKTAFYLSKIYEKSRKEDEE